MGQDGSSALRALTTSALALLEVEAWLAATGAACQQSEVCLATCATFPCTMHAVIQMGGTRLACRATDCTRAATTGRAIGPACAPAGAIEMQLAQFRCSGAYHDRRLRRLRRLRRTRLHLRLRRSCTTTAEHAQTNARLLDQKSITLGPRIAKSIQYALEYPPPTPPTPPPPRSA